MASLGHELKKLREERGVSLQQISASTHIGVRFLQAIENDTYDILPGGVFNRAFVRKFAHKVGMDEEQALRLYDEQLGDMGGEPERKFYTGLEDFDQKSSSSNNSLYSILAVLILAAGAYVAYTYFFKTGASQEQRLAQAQSTPTPEPSPTIAAETPTPSPSPEVVVDGLIVKIAADTGECWMKITPDAEKPQEATLAIGQFREISVKDKFTLSVGYWPALKITINGKGFNFNKYFPNPNPKNGVATGIVVTKENYLQYVD